MKFETFLKFLVLQQTQDFFDSVLEADDPEQAIEDAYLDAHWSGSVAQLVFLLGIALRPKEQRTSGVIAYLAREFLQEVNVGIGLDFTLTNPRVLEPLKAQARTAAGILRANISNGDDPVVATARAAHFGARWGIAQGQIDAVENSTIEPDEGSQLVKTWVRLAPRREHRSHHDALEGLTIPYNDNFQLNSPSGSYNIFRPYDPALPLSETFNCGHGIRVWVRGNATVQAWTGS